jgi:hypothetical protein
VVDHGLLRPHLGLRHRVQRSATVVDDLGSQRPRCLALPWGWIPWAAWVSRPTAGGWVWQNRLI